MTWKGTSIPIRPPTILLNNSRVICEIERALRRGASTPRMEYGKSKIERHKLEIQETLNVLNMQNSSLGGDDRVGECASKPLADGCRDSPEVSTPQSGKSCLRLHRHCTGC